MPGTCAFVLIIVVLASESFTLEGLAAVEWWGLAFQGEVFEMK